MRSDEQPPPRLRDEEGGLVAGTNRHKSSVGSDVDGALLGEQRQQPSAHIVGDVEQPRGLYWSQGEPWCVAQLLPQPAEKLLAARVVAPLVVGFSICHARRSSNVAAIASHDLARPNIGKMPHCYTDEPPAARVLVLACNTFPPN